MFHICGDVETVGFPVQNVYKMTYGDENATFEPLNIWTRERLRIFKGTTSKSKSPAFYCAIWQTLNSLYNMWHIAKIR